ncbi:DUF1996 domain-containing protein [Streptomyces sp. NPDC005423]|uniref:DUF1996 domain-containing protein n=1 Tax=Streptomyces sp. NPDC005423 TaxID=3155343 RepID=UPI0033A2C137
MLGGGGLVAANVYASAAEGGRGGDSSQHTDSAAPGGSSGAGTIDCPDVGSRLTTVPEGAKSDVDTELALLDQQTAEAYQKLQNSAQAIGQDAGFADSAIMSPLKEKRAATLERIAVAIDRVGERPQGLDDLAACTLRPSDNQNGAGQGQQQGDSPGQSGQPTAGQTSNGGQTGNGGQAGNGPVAADYADITTVQPNVRSPQQQADASRGTFTTRCGVNANGLFNSDNVIVAPGVTNGAHHFHDYVGNQSNNAFASDQDLATADTSCADKGDRSTYYWPVLRLQNGTQERDANSPGGGTEGNAGRIVTAKQVTLTFQGNPRGKVTEMPRLLRIITGDAKAFVNGPANANASWSCTGFEDRQLKDKYPLCPKGSDVVRTFRFQSCWDGRNIDSANHRTHVAFATADGACPEGFEPIPQLVQRIVYGVGAPSLADGGRTVPFFAVDSFPEQLHKPVTDHGDFINVFDESLMREMVGCINDGRRCGAGSGSGSGGGDQGGTTPPAEPTAGNGAGGGNGSGDVGGGDNGGATDPGTGGGEPSAEPTAEPSDTVTATPSATDRPGAPATEPAEGVTPTLAEPKADTKTSGVHDAATAAPSRGGSGDASGGEVGTAVRTPDPTITAGGGETSVAAPQTEPQAVQGGGLAETGAHLWPAALGALLLIGGFVLLRRGGRAAR